MLRPLYGPPILQNQILDHCKGLQSFRIRFWAFASVCNPSESDSGPLQQSAILQNQILGHCNGLQSSKIRFWAIARVCKASKSDSGPIARVCKASESDSGPLQRSAKRQNQILGHCKGLQSVRIRFWAFARVCNPPKSDSEEPPERGSPCKPSSFPSFHCAIRLLALP